jgi:hypothetical protein
MNPDDPNGPFTDPDQARAYLNGLSAHGSRQGDTSFLHPDYAVRMANAIKQARAAGLPVTLQSGFRTPDVTGSGYDSAGYSLHGYGASGDVGGIGGAGSPQAQKWAKIAQSNGLSNPYGVGNPQEYNHWQLVPWKLESRPDIQAKLIAAKGDGPTIWNAISPISAGSAMAKAKKTATEPADDPNDPVLRLLKPDPASPAAPKSAPADEVPASDPNDPVLRLLKPDPSAPVTGQKPGSYPLGDPRNQGLLPDSYKTPPPPNAPAPDEWSRDQSPLVQMGYNARDVGRYALGQAASVPGAIRDNFNASTNLLSQGISEGATLPSFPSSDPRTWSAGGVLKTAVGGLGAVTSPISGAVQSLVQAPVTAASGNPELGEKAGMVASTIGGPLAGNLLSRMTPAVLPASRAANMVREAVGSSGPSSEIAARLAANPNLRLIDVDPLSQANALGMATNPKYPAYGILRRSADETSAAAPGAANASYDAAMGQTPNVKELLDGLDAKLKSNAAEGYGAAWKEARPVNISPVIDSLNKIENPGVSGVVSKPSNIPPSTASATATDIKSLLADENGSVLTDPERLHQIQSQLRVAAEGEARRGTMEGGIRAKQLSDARRGIIDALDEATDWKYSEARIKYREDASVQDAFDKGTSIYKNSTIEDRPEYWEDWKKNARPEEIEAAKLGMRVAADKSINGTRFSARNGQNIPEVPFNLEKMKIILGDKEAGKLAQELADQKAMATTNSLLYGGSKTALSRAAQEATEVRKVSPWSLSSAGALPAIAAELYGTGHLGAGAIYAGGVGANYLGRISDIGRNTAAARLYTLPGGEAINKLYPGPTSASIPLSVQAVPGAVGFGNKLVNPPRPSDQ